jgi:hypothetical protein
LLLVEEEAVVTPQVIKVVAAVALAGIYPTQYL